MISLQIATTHGSRTYHLLPTPSHSPSPLVIFLHGAGSTALWADEETGWSRLASDAGFTLALPEGLPLHPSQSPKFLTNPQRWNDGSVGPTGVPSPADDVAFLQQMIDQILDRVPVDTRRIFVSGFSNGAGMAFRLAAEMAWRLAAIAPVAGYCWFRQQRPVRPVPTLYILGEADPLVPPRGGVARSPWLHRLIPRPPVADSLDYWAQAIGCVPPPRLEAEDPSLRVELYPGPVEFRSLLVKGLGHHWPGGLGRLSPKIAGPASDSLNATRTIWEFFSRQEIPAC